MYTISVFLTKCNTWVRELEDAFASNIILLTLYHPAYLSLSTLLTLLLSFFLRAVLRRLWGEPGVWWPVCCGLRLHVRLRCDGQWAAAWLDRGGSLRARSPRHLPGHLPRRLQWWAGQPVPCSQRRLDQGLPRWRAHAASAVQGSGIVMNREGYQSIVVSDV